MDRLNRFIKAVEYLKTKAEEPTNESVAKLLRYKSLNYISDIIGGSKEISPFVLERMVEFSINKEWVETGNGEMIIPIKNKSINKEDPSQIFLDTSTIKVTLQDYIDLLKTMNHKEEERSKELISIIKELAAGQKAISDALLPVKEMSEEILTNSKKTQGDLRALKTEVVAEHGEMMETLDQIAGNEPGTTAAKAGTVELAHQVQKNQKGKKANMGKQS
jgi:hypothetical protein